MKAKQKRHRKPREFWVREHALEMEKRNNRREARVSSFDLYAAPNRRRKPNESRGATVPSHKRVKGMGDRPLSLPMVDPVTMERLESLASSWLGMPQFPA